MVKKMRIKENKKLVNQRNNAGSIAEQLNISNQCSFVLRFSCWAKEAFISSQSENLPHQHPFFFFTSKAKPVASNRFLLQ